MWELLLSGLGSAVGGFLGVMVYRMYLEKKEATPLLIQEYHCANEPNQGQEDEQLGQLMHHHGHPITTEEEYKNLGSINPIWEWSRQETGRPTDKQPLKSVIYGPYSTDCRKPGLYHAIFRIKATGIASSADVHKHLTLLTLDVNHIEYEYSGFETHYRLDEVHRRVGVRYLRADELTNDGWREYEVPFYSDGTGMWEYRVIAKDGSGDHPDNIGKFGDKVRIFFDAIQIQQVREIRL